MTTPKKIVAMRTFTYDVEEVIDSIREMNDEPEMDVPLSEVWDLVSEWARDDMREATQQDMVWADENGNPIKR